VDFSNELRVAYAAEIASAEHGLQPSRHSYADYVRWQNDMLEGSQGQVLWNYLQQQLSAANTVLDLPRIGRARPCRVNAVRRSLSSSILI